jgi:hypothetical protein
LKKAGLQFAIIYEGHATTALLRTGRILAANKVQHGVDLLNWVSAHWFSDPAYVRINQQPIFLIFGGPEVYHDLQWDQVLKSVPNPPLFFSLHHRNGGASGCFDWPLPDFGGLSALDDFYKREKDPSKMIPTAFARFNDCYAAGKVEKGHAQIADDNGQTFASTLARAMTSGAPVVQIATWNDWGEGTQIEPSTEFGYRDLEAIQAERRKINPKFAFTADDLRLPLRLYKLRGREKAEPALKPKLDEIARQIAADSSAEAKTALEKLEKPQ